MYFAITIDTEEDNWGEYERPSYTVENIGRIPRLQGVFTARGARPTYLITYPVATTPAAVDTLGCWLQQGQCEIGTHPHPWNTPPFEEARTPYNSFISHLPVDLQYRKISTLHQAIARNFGVPPVCYRSGRWGFNDDVARNLIRLGYRIDTSISPAFDWSAYGGPDYSDRSPNPFVFEMRGTQNESLLEVPATIGFLQTEGRVASRAFWSINRLPFGSRALGVLEKIGALNHVCLSPETHDATRMIRLIEVLLDRGVKVVNMFFHSPSLLENCSPFVKTAADLTAFITRIDEVLAFAQTAGLKFVTMSELRAEDIGATSVRLLPESPN